MQRAGCPKGRSRCGDIRRRCSPGPVAETRRGHRRELRSKDVRDQQLAGGNHNHPLLRAQQSDPNAKFSVGEPCMPAHGVTNHQRCDIAPQRASCGVMPVRFGELRLQHSSALGPRPPAPGLGREPGRPRRGRPRSARRESTAALVNAADRIAFGPPVANRCPLNPAQHPFPGQPGDRTIVADRRAVAEDINRPQAACGICGGNRRA